MSDLIERAKAFQDDYVTVWHQPALIAIERNRLADFAQSERTRIAAELEALSQKTPRYALVTALLEYADGLRQKKQLTTKQ